MVKIKGGGINYGDLITNIIKYGVLIVLFGICILYIDVANVQFIIFVVLLITVVLGSAIVIKDLSDLSSFMNIVKPNDNKEFSIEKPNPSFFKIFMGVFGVAAIMKIISLVFFILTLNKSPEGALKPYTKLMALTKPYTRDLITTTKECAIVINNSITSASNCNCNSNSNILTLNDLNEFTEFLINNNYIITEHSNSNNATNNATNNTKKIIYSFKITL